MSPDDHTGSSRVEADTAVARVRNFVAASDWEADRIEALCGDISSRCYFRLHDGPRTAIVSAYPENDWSIAERFLRSTALLLAAGIRVPAVLASDSRQRLLLLEDVGHSTCYELAVDVGANTEQMFRRAAELLPAILGLDLDREHGLLPPLDAQALDAELEISVTALDARTESSAGKTDLRDLVAPLREAISGAVSRMPLRPAHRDLMLRNLMPMPDGSLAVLDHQDLRPAPFGYDFASLVNDSVFPTHEEAEALRREFLPALEPADYHCLAAQRTLKAAGSYARALQAGNAIHRDLIAPTLERSLQHLTALPETADLAAQLGARLGRC